MRRKFDEVPRRSGWGRWGAGLAGGAAAAALALTTGCQEEGPFLQTEQYSTVDGEETYNGGACMPVQQGNAMGGGTAPGAGSFGGEANEAEPDAFSFSYEGTGAGVRLLVVDGENGVLAERHYDEAFIRSGKKDEVVVELGRGGMRFVSWGVERCEAIREPESP
jgi:hypothetical protein